MGLDLSKKSTEQREWLQLGDLIWDDGVWEAPMEEATFSWDLERREDYPRERGERLCRHGENSVGGGPQADKKLAHFRNRGKGGRRGGRAESKDSRDRWK